MKKKEVLIQRLQRLRDEMRMVEAELLSQHGGNLKSAPVSSPFSLQGRVINATIKLIRQKKSPVSSKEILVQLSKEAIDLGHYPPMMLAAILGQEVNKKSARLIRIARGLYAIKSEHESVPQQ